VISPELSIFFDVVLLKGNLGGRRTSNSRSEWKGERVDVASGGSMMYYLVVDEGPESGDGEGGGGEEGGNGGEQTEEERTNDRTALLTFLPGQEKVDRCRQLIHSLSPRCQAILHLTLKLLLKLSKMGTTSEALAKTFGNLLFF
jgi:hypothetical protein